MIAAGIFFIACALFSKNNNLMMSIYMMLIASILIGVEGGDWLASHWRF